MKKMSICLIDDDDWFRDMFCQYMVDCFHGIDITSELPDDWKKGRNAGEAGEYRECDLYIFGGAGPEYLPEDPDDGILEKSLFLCCREDEISEARKRFPNINMIYKFISATKLVEHINSMISTHRREGKVRPVSSRFLVISVTSSAGGMGKTSVSLMISRLLQQKKSRSVLIVSTSLLCSMRKYFPVESVQKQRTLNEYIYHLFAEDRPERSLTSYMIRDRFGVSSFYTEREINELASLDDGEMARFVESLEASREYDIVIFDLDNSNDKVTGTIASKSDFLIVLSPPESEGEDMTEYWISNIVKNSGGRHGEIVRITNMEGYAGGGILFYEEGEEYTGSRKEKMSIPYDPHSFYRAEGMKQISMTGAFAAAVDRIIEEVMLFV